MNDDASSIDDASSRNGLRGTLSCHSPLQELVATPGRADRSTSRVFSDRCGIDDIAPVRRFLCNLLHLPIDATDRGRLRDGLQGNARARAASYGRGRHQTLDGVDCLSSRELGTRVSAPCRQGRTLQRPPVNS